jgi:hypothetical protein
VCVLDLKTTKFAKLINESATRLTGRMILNFSSLDSLCHIEASENDSTGSRNRDGRAGGHNVTSWRQSLSYPAFSGATKITETRRCPVLFVTSCSSSKVHQNVCTWKRTAAAERLTMCFLVVYLRFCSQSGET